jgi:hypothetical protein
VLPTLPANAAAHVRGVRAVLEVVTAGCRQGGLQSPGPFLVGPSKPPHLIGGQAKIAQHLPERLAAVDCVQELLPHLGWEPLLRSGPSASSLIVGMCLGAEDAVAACVPSRVGAVRRLPYWRESSEIVKIRHWHSNSKPWRTCASLRTELTAIDAN